MSTFDERGCGCCQGPQTAEPIDNRPALPAIQYRLGTYSTFMRAMLVAAAARPELKAWTARSPRDFGMQFLDLWAYLADILTFYQERIANEAYLRTATQRENVMRLAAAIDYRLGPGAAAIVHLAFTLDKQKTLTIPVGLKAQSIPGQNEKPQKFETIEAIEANASWNRLRVFPQPQAVVPFAPGRTGGTLVNEPARPKLLSPGMKVVIFDTRIAENKEIAAVASAAAGIRLQWTLPVKGSFANPEARPYGRQFRLFGSQAPSKFTVPTADSTVPGGIRWVIQTPSFLIAAQTSGFSLETVVEDLKPGAEMLVAHTTSNTAQRFVRKGTVISAAPLPASRGAIEATVTQVQLQLTGSVPVGLSQVDLRNITLYELTGAPIQFATSEYPPEICGNRVYIPVDVLPAYPLKRSIILDDQKGDPHIAAVDSATVSADHLVIAFTPAPSRCFSTDTCVLLGNVAKATHGETVKDEVLGNGDASSRLQKFQLRKTPVTFIPQPGAPHGVANTLQVRVDGVLWKEVVTLLGEAPDARVYATAVADDAKMTVQFGGEPGSRLPSGRNNVVAQYRQGLGPDGNVRAASITTLLDRPVGLKSVVNPAVASGGSAPEPLETARANAPNTVRTFGRIVSLTDFEDAARELSTVAKAKSSLSWTGNEQEVSVAVAGEAGKVLSAEVLRGVLADLNSRRDVNRRLTIRAHQNVAVRISGRVQVNPAYLLDAVQSAVNAALLDLFRFENRDLGEPAFISDAFRVAQAVAGVVAIDLDNFKYRDLPGGDLPDVLTAQPFQILSLDPADIDLLMQFETI
ncbi:MAG: baseplate J/gp47 family protein [Bryobacteraceae bacterium]|nr:baseplate J/gp47 family protein [Bryobacteraceae bacterium]